LILQDAVCFSCAQILMIPPLWFIAVGWSWQMLDCFYCFYPVLQRHSVVPFFPIQGFFCRCYKSGATTIFITMLHVLHTQQFWSIAYL
jgi:hypothetical protein